MEKPSDETLRELYDTYGGCVADVAKHLKRPRTTVQGWYNNLGVRGAGTAYPNREYERKEIKVDLPIFPDDDLPVEDLIETQCRRFEKRLKFSRSKKWFPVKIHTDQPIGLCFIGDPHVDDNGCNWPLLKHHCQLMRDTEGMFAVNIGDTENNWIGRLAKLYAHQDTSTATARKFTDWLLKDSGVPWLVWLMGNHDMWGDLSEVMRANNVQRIPMEDWQAQFKLVFSNKVECKVWAAHDFKGHSMWNSLHGPQKAAHMKNEAHIYACGHTHNWATHQEESASRDFTYWLVRARGYKFIDQYAELLGHFSQEEGATVCTVINPQAKSHAGFIQAFADMDIAADYLTYLRSK